MQANFEGGLQVVSAARKLIFKVPQGPVVSFPMGAVISPYGQNNTAPVIVVRNGVDTAALEGTWQGADAENGVVIMNNVPTDLAMNLLDMYEASPTIEGLLAVIAEAESQGQFDNYTTPLVGFVDTKLSPAGRMLGEGTGMVKRHDRDVCLVVRDEAGVIWRHLMVGGAPDIRHIDSDEILVRDYVMADGSQIDPESIPAVANA